MSESKIIGGEDWDLVLRHEPSESYEWSRMDVYYSPSARRYFWYSDSGCSCNYFDATHSHEFIDGDREAACRAVREFCTEDYFSTDSDAVDCISTIKTFKEPK